MSTFPTRIWLNSGPYTGPVSLVTTGTYASTSTIKRYVINVPAPQYGIEFHHVSGTTRFKLNEVAHLGSTDPPDSFYIVRGGTTLGPYTDEVVQDGDQINTFAGTSAVYGFLIDMNGGTGTDTYGNTVGPNKLLFTSGGGPVNTLSGGSSPEIKDITFTKASDTIVYLAFNWQNINTAFLFVDSGGTVTQTNIALGGQGQSGSVGSSGFLTNMQDGDKVWIANTDTVDSPYIHKYVEWSYDRFTKKVIAKAFFVHNGGSGFGQNADVALVRMLTSTYGAVSLLEAQADPTNGFANHNGTLKTLTLDAKPGSRWAISNIDTSQYGSSYRVPGTKVFSNFW